MGNDADISRSALLRPLLVVEDSDEDFEALQRVFQKLNIANSVHRCRDGNDCLDYLQHKGRYESASKQILPALVLLDLNMPATDGRQTLQVIKSEPKLRSVPVTILTTSSNPVDVQTCYDSGANAYVLKPLAFNDLLKSIRVVTDFWLRTVVAPV